MEPFPRTPTLIPTVSAFPGRSVSTTKEETLMTLVTSGRRNSRRIWTFLLALAAALAGTLVLPGTANAAAGGGCGVGVRVDSCISYDASLGTVVADSYYHGTPPSRCVHSTSIYSGTGQRLATQNWDHCDSGWNPGVSYSTRSARLGGSFFAYTCFSLVPPGPWVLLGCTYSPSLYLTRIRDY